MSEGRRCAIVTGGSRGIGAAIAVRLAEDGYNIGFCYRSNSDAAVRTTEALAAAGADFVHQAVDVAKKDEVDDFVAKVTSNLGPAHTVVNCAGITRDRVVLLMGQDDWSQVMDVNLTGAYNLCRATARGLIRERGTIVNVTSVRGILGSPGQVNYSASKSGVHGLTVALARELGRFGVRVNAVAPGFINTDMIESAPASLMERMRTDVSLGRLGAADEVASVVSFLVSDQASYVTGAVLRVDGGYELRA